MKIIHISPLYYPVVGGAELHLKELCESLALRGHEVTVMTANVTNNWDLWSGKYGGLPDRESVNGVKVLRFHPEGDFWGRALEKWISLRGGCRTLNWILTSEGFEMLCRYPRILPIIPSVLRHEADIVVSMNWYWPPSYHMYLARKLKRFILVGIPLFHTAESWCKQAIYERMLNQCDAVVTNTKYEADFVRERAAVRVEVAGVGIHPDAFAQRHGDEIRSRYRLGKSHVVGFVGKQLYSKGVHRLIMAMRLVWKWNQDVRIILAGRCPKRPDNIDLLIGSLPEYEREQIIRIDGFSDMDKPSLFDAFDVFVLPSTEESFGIAYLEAWVCGKPVIGTRIGSTQCVIDEGVDGLLAELNDPQDLALKIIELLSNPDERMRLGRNGCKKAETRYTWSNVTQVIESLYVELLRAKSSPALGMRDQSAIIHD